MSINLARARESSDNQIGPDNQIGRRRPHLRRGVFIELTSSGVGELWYARASSDPKEPCFCGRPRNDSHEARRIAVNIAKLAERLRQSAQQAAGT